MVEFVFGFMTVLKYNFIVAPGIYINLKGTIKFYLQVYIHSCDSN